MSGAHSVMMNKIAYLELRLGLANHVDQGGHVLLSGYSKGIHESTIHGIMQDRIQCLRTLVGGGESIRWSQCA